MEVMGRQVITTYVCDLCGAELGSDRQRVSFGSAETLYDMDLCPRDGREVTDALSRWRSAATASGRYRAYGTPQQLARVERPAARAPSAPERSPFEVAAIRRWAREQGIEVSERGRVARSVVEQYDAARPATTD
jgi:hypothetical protein